MSDPLVWLPFDPSHLQAATGELPRGLRYEVVDPAEHVPESVEDVRFYVAPYQMGTAVGDVVPRMTSLEVVQVLSAGVDNVRDRVPEGVLLCNGRGIHDTSTAELTLALVLASLRDVPGMVRDQEARRWNTRWRPALADKRVLL
ncbi:MAG: dihydrofolate reductase, partial [Actinomycetota bacterium]|nr:dihydrofolate reductase [Actinomycetota bacterium]